MKLEFNVKHLFEHLFRFCGVGAKSSSSKRNVRLRRWRLKARTWHVVSLQKNLSTHKRGWNYLLMAIRQHAVCIFTRVF